MSAEEICEASSKLITFIDLAGHQKYIKTTIFGLTAHRPDFSMLVVGANSGAGKLTFERFGQSRLLAYDIRYCAILMNELTIVTLGTNTGISVAYGTSGM